MRYCYRSLDVLKIRSYVLLELRILRCQIIFRLGNYLFDGLDLIADEAKLRSVDSGILYEELQRFDFVAYVLLLHAHHTDC